MNKFTKCQRNDHEVRNEVITRTQIFVLRQKNYRPMDFLKREFALIDLSTHNNNNNNKY